MKYILMDSALLYMLETFPRKAVPELYNIFCDKCDNGNIICERESKKSMDNLLEEEASFAWMKEHNKVFRAITQKESKILGELIDEGVFDFVNKSRTFERNIPVTIPFVIAIAINEARTIVADKKSKDYLTLQSICKKKNISILEIDDFLSQIA